MRTVPPSHTPALLRIGTRKSALARFQTDQVRGFLAAANPTLRIEIETFTTQGDKNLSAALPEVGGKGVFTAELEAALLAGAIDIAVHSLKDLPTETPAGLALGAVPRRANPADVLVSAAGHTLSSLPRGAAVGTSSPRRASQLLHIRRDLRILDIRGNVDTRITRALDKDGPYDAIVLAYAGLDRLGRLDAVSEVLDFDVMLPAPGQGALAVQCRDDPSVVTLVRSINHDETEIAVTAEKAFLAGLGGGCSLPICALASVENTKLRLRGRVASRDGSNCVDVAGDAVSADLSGAREVGEKLARAALDNGAAEILGSGA
jgi:hydroxymethylbilane synthase